MGRREAGESFLCPVQALGQWITFICQIYHGEWIIFLSTYWQGSKWWNVTEQDICIGLKSPATWLDYPECKHRLLDCIDTYSLWSCGVNASWLISYSGWQMQKMGCWWRVTFTEYIHEEFGISQSTKTKFGFINISGGIHNDITHMMLLMGYKQMP